MTSAVSKKAKSKAMISSSKPRSSTQKRHQVKPCNTLKRNRKHCVGKGHTQKGGMPRRDHSSKAADNNTTDILYQDKDICILNPSSKRGVLVFSRYNEQVTTICTDGLKTQAQLHKEGIINKDVLHSYSFFRAPYLANDIDYTSIDTEILSSFGEDIAPDKKNMVWIRVDPDKTYVYSSEIRARYRAPHYYGSQEYLDAMQIEVNESRKLMHKYLKILDSNSKILKEDGKKLNYNLHTSKGKLVPKTIKTEYPYDHYPINTNSEILVRMPNLTPNYFVKCT